MSDEKKPKNVYRDVEWQMIEQRFNSSNPRERYIEPEELAKLINAYAGEPLPTGLMSYLSELALGKIKRPRGRPKDSQAATRNSFIYAFYATFSDLLKKQNEDPTLDGWDFLLIGDARDRAFHEQAAFMVVELVRRMKVFPQCDVRHVLNLVSRARQT
ncbi:MAG: hypothetical protein ACK4NA_02155 [Alphaproteobacteria bacterium]